MTLTRPENAVANSRPPVGDEHSMAAGAVEPQRGQSDSAAMMKTPLERPTDLLMEKIVERANLELAWRKVRSNQGAPGPDGVTIDEFLDCFRVNWPAIEQQLLEGTYQPGPARRKSILKPDGGERHLALFYCMTGRT